VEEEVLANSEISVIEEPRPGTLAWLQQRPHVDVLGLSLPNAHRIAAGSTLAEPDGRCRVIRPNGERCRSVPTRLYGICISHLGGGEQDGARLSKIGNQTKVRLKAQRRLLGISGIRTANPRQIARVAALERAETLAEALLAPLDDIDLGSLARQRAAVTVLDATFPIQTTQVEVEIPADSDGVEALGWEQMQALAARLLDE
jgi:hypothetical protein